MILEAFPSHNQVQSQLPNDFFLTFCNVTSNIFIRPSYTRPLFTQLFSRDCLHSAFRNHPEYAILT